MTAIREKTYQYSEIFGRTIQGEGHYTGVPTVWIRFWGCNLECNGFGQDNPLDKSTWVLDYQTIDVKSIKNVNDLPVFNRGCDSSYSWSKQMAHLASKGTASEICDRITAFMITESNPEGLFLHPKSKQWIHLAFTGGEPMMNQNAIVDIMQEFERRGNAPKFVTVETNGTQKARDKFTEYFAGSIYATPHGEWFWSISPKLFLSGEQWEDTIKPEVVSQYHDLSTAGQLKYVVDGSVRAWDEVEGATNMFRDRGVQYPIWVMPVGATMEGQEKCQAKVTEEAVDRGYNVAARVHCSIFGNLVGK